MKKIILIILSFVLILQVGCGAGNNEYNDNNELEEIVAEIGLEDKIIIDRSEDISDYVVELFGIDDAATIIFNDTALVSVVMAYDLELTLETKELIEDIVSEKDKEIHKVLITSDEKVFSQTVEIIGNLMKGTPYDKHVNEISKMIEKQNKKN